MVLKSIVLGGVLLSSLAAPAAHGQGLGAPQAALQALSKQISTLRVSLQAYKEHQDQLTSKLLACNSATSFYAPDNPRANSGGCVTERSCNGQRHSSVRSRQCPPGEIGSILDQCMDGVWEEKLNDCLVGQKTFVLIGSRSADDGSASDFFKPKGTIDKNAAHIRGYQAFSADPTTAAELCRMKEFKKAVAVTGTGYSSCGDNWLITYTGGGFKTINACAAGARYMRRVTCSNL